MRIIVLILAIPVCIALVFLTSMSYFAFNPLSIDYKQQTEVRTLIPQGWAFFTRNPREQALLFYKKENHRWILVNSSGGSYDKLFGLSRLSRRQNIELGGLAAQLNFVKNWIHCDNSLPDACMPDSTNVLYTKFKKPLVLGEYIVRLAEPVPWAWRTVMTEEQRKSKVLKIMVVYDSTKVTKSR